MRIGVPDLVSNSYFPAIAAVDLGALRAEGLDAEVELVFPVTRAMELLRDGERLLRIEHRTDGRVLAMAHRDGTVRYDYDARGFRTAAEYGGRVSSALGYDAAGNLVRYALATGGRTVLS